MSPRARFVLLVPMTVVLVVATAAARPAESRRPRPSQASSAAEAHRTYNIPPQDAASALAAWATQSGLRVVFPRDAVRGKQTPAVVGSFGRGDALRRLAGAVGLDIVTWGSDVVTLGSSEGQATAATSDLGVTEDVTVTANKREQTVRDVAGTITPLTGRMLDQQGAGGFADYLVGVPGVAFHQTQPGSSQITIRGVTTTTFTDQGQQTTGFYVNDIPTTEPYYSVGVPDLDPFDVERIEVLRGPQGTLFGSSTMGGAVNFIATRARLEGVEGRVEMSPSSTGGGPGWGLNSALKAMVNVPVVRDRLAVRVVGTYRKSAGFVHNVGLQRERSDSATFGDGRVSVEWQATPRLRLSEMSLYSRSSADDSARTDYALGGFQRKTMVPEPYKLTTTIHSLRGQYAFDKVLLSAQGAWTEKLQFMSPDLTNSFGSFFSGLVPYANAPQDGYARAKLAEVRASSAGRQKLEWLVGASHSRHEEDFVINAYAPGGAAAIETLFGPAFGQGIGAKVAPNDVWEHMASPITAQESAFFGEVTYHIDERWQATFGGRGFKTRVDTVDAQSGFLTYLASATTAVRREKVQDERGFTPKASISYSPGSRVVVYGLVSTGYRFGGANLAPPNPTYPTPEFYGSDSLVNYEVGTRIDWLDRRLSLGLTPYYIRWKDIQLRQGRPDGFAYAVNSGRAGNLGIDVTLRAAAGRHLTLDSAFGLLDAKLLDDITASGMPVPSGSRLPGTPRVTVSAAGTYSWSGPSRPRLGATYRYVGEAPLDLQDSMRQGGYSVVDVRGSIETAGARLEVFVDNLFYSKGVVTAYPLPSYPFPPLGAFYVRPRTAGIRIVYDLK